VPGELHAALIAGRLAPAGEIHQNQPVWAEPGADFEGADDAHCDAPAAGEPEHVRTVRSSGL
jgi:hypothetical protein